MWQLQGIHNQFLLIILNYTQNILILCVEKIVLCEYACKYKNSFCKVLTSSIPVY